LKDKPTLVIENKVLYSRQVSSEPPVGYDLLCTDETFPTVHLKPKSPAEVTIISLGGISLEAEEAIHKLFYEEEIICELYMPIQLYPFTIDAIRDSLVSTQKLLVIEEGQGFASISSEIIAQVAEELGGSGIKCQRVFASENPIPAARPLEDECLPNLITIFNYVKDLYNGNSRRN